MQSIILPPRIDRYQDAWQTMLFAARRKSEEVGTVGSLVEIDSVLCFENPERQDDVDVDITIKLIGFDATTPSDVADVLRALADHIS